MKNIFLDAIKFLCLMKIYGVKKYCDQGEERHDGNEDG
jgi:hypothetical protein